MKIFQVTWNNKHVFKVLSNIVPTFFSLIVRNATRITTSVKSAVFKYFSSTGNTALDSSTSLNASKALDINQGIIPKQNVDSVSHKVISISNTGYPNVFAHILFAIGFKISNSTMIKNSAKAISALVANLDARQVKIIDKMTILLTKQESVKNSIISKNSLSTLSFKDSLCYSNLYILNSAIDIIKKMYANIFVYMSIDCNIHFGMMALKKLSAIDALTLGEIDTLTLGALDILQEY